MNSLEKAENEKISLSLVATGDGSKTIYNPVVGEHYHSRHGALQESKHVFLNAGLQYFLSQFNTGSVSILEVGFGTGLNFLLTADYCDYKGIHLDYMGIEAYPLNSNLLQETGYHQYIQGHLWNSFINSYETALNATATINSSCFLNIAAMPLMEFSTEKKYDLVYFDAFAAAYQPEMWSDQAISHTINFLKPGGVFVTYAITGHLKRLISTLGCTIEKIKGAPGKREMLRAIKTA
jgi:tRNA U34 5-methylaminomethyl-2-thiouridine-forming methyltransferase MnmC